MIQIKSTIFRNLDKFCQEHYDSLQEYINVKLAGLSVRQKEFIEENIKIIITGKPDKLWIVNKEYNNYCTRPGRNKIKNINKGLEKVFNYNWFTKKDANYYCGYDLANKLNVKSCPYCNRNYTVTVNEGKSRVVRPDFDHFFPRKQYPLLALSFYNLIPSCLICNRTIKNQAKIVYGKFIHPYEEGFNDALRINYIPRNVESSVGIKSDYNILAVPNPIQPLKANKCLESFKLFKIKEIYEVSHNVEIADIIRKFHISNGKYLEQLLKTFPEIGSIDELYRIAFGNFLSEDEFEKKPLSKLTRDIVEQLTLKMNGENLFKQNKL